MTPKKKIIGNCITKFVSTNTVLCPASPHRRSVTISNPTANALWLNFGSNAPTLISILIPPNFLPFTFNKKNVGNLITGDIIATFSTASSNLTFLETLYG